MACSLVFDGVNDYLDLTTDFSLADGEYIDFHIIAGALDSGYEMWCGTWGSVAGSSVGEWYFGKLNSTDGRLTLYNRGNGARNNSATGTLVEGEDAVFRLERVGNTLRVLKNSVEVIAPLSFGAGEIDAANIKKLFKENETATSFCFTGKVRSVTVDTRYKLDATASDTSNTGAQPILVDSVGTNDGQGFNFPTNGDAWDGCATSSTVPVLAMNYNRRRI